jgi:hypothetical protein
MVETISCVYPLWNVLGAVVLCCFAFLFVYFMFKALIFCGCGKWIKK